ncbi:MAG TPA: RNA polymerase sigma factor [Thermoanaerobaculia bacterium]|nr:RNA polymerase sigma factor [Thermoanaerobaculia bacterium]HUM29307.1 RNA polymerase sigma factor [Thermoanaerobaculia bacterium]HXK67735.1 RNA polymerase sigma factor [Thermoanaerobaculia bacterium]
MNDSILVERCLAGDETAWKSLVDRYARPVFSVCFQFTGNGHDAEDLTQEVFLKIYSNLHRYAPRYPFLTWAMKIARNLCIDEYRRRKTERSFNHIGDEYLHLLSSSSDPHGETQQRDELNRALSALHRLPEESVAMILMRDLMGFSYDELSDIFEVPVGTVKSRLNRGRFAVAMEIHDTSAHHAEMGVQA